VAEAAIDPPADMLDLDRAGRVMMPRDGRAAGRVSPARLGVGVEPAQPAQRRRIARPER
jgi:hypothetical protein